MSVFLCTLNCTKHGNTLLFRLLRQIGQIDVPRDSMQTQTDPAPICFKRQRREPAFFSLIQFGLRERRSQSGKVRMTPGTHRVLLCNPFKAK